MVSVGNALAFILMETAALSMVMHGDEVRKSMFASIGHGFMAVVLGAGDSVKDYFSLRSQNAALARENSVLLSEISAYRKMLSDSDGRIAPHPVEDNFSYTPATVVRMSRNRQHNYFIIDKGFEDGIYAQSGIITAKGAIGIVDAVDRHCSYCLSFQNSSISISARIGRRGPVGKLVWDGKTNDRGTLKEIPLQTRFSRGDTVWTSGHSSIFPTDIPLGIAGEARIMDGSTYDIDINLFENFSSVRYVTVAYNAGREEIMGLENLVEGLE